MVNVNVCLFSGSNLTALYSAEVAFKTKKSLASLNSEC